MEFDFHSMIWGVCNGDESMSQVADFPNDGFFDYEFISDCNFC